jgi:hypothetical protein
MCNHVQDLEPDPDVLGPLGHGPSRLTHKLLSIEPNLDPVVEQSKKGSQGKGSDKDGDETEL